jgi:CubicO group peptidase (beta-lactamase class C family)
VKSQDTGPSARIVSGEAGRHPRDEPVVPWWSFTKTALAATALVLVDRGRLSLDEPVGSFNYTLRHLLQHTSGLPDYGWIREYHDAVTADRDPWTREELLRRAKADALRFAPGTSWSYSNIGYLFVREMIEQSAGCDLEEALRVLLFEPLEIENVFVATNREEMRRTLWGRKGRYHPGWVYHGLLAGPPSAAASLLHRLLLGDLLSAPLKAEMLIPRSVGVPLPDHPAVEPSYGLGVMIDPGGPCGRVVGHTGQGPGSTCAVYSLLDLPTPRTLAAFVDDDSHQTPGMLEAHILRQR